MARSSTSELRFGILGPLEVRNGEALLPVGGPKARAVLAMLVLEAGRIVSTDRLIDGVWGEDPPNTVMAALQVHVSNLRKALGENVLVTRPPGYVLDVAREQVDHCLFEAAVSEARRARQEGRIADARATLVDALGLWRGTPFADVLDAPFKAATTTWLNEQRSAVDNDLIELAIELGDHRDAISQLEAAIARTPHREELWAHLMRALYRSGRQADALAAFQRARDLLLDDLGIEPGPELRRLEAAVLEQADELDVRSTTQQAVVARAPAPLASTIKARSVARARLVLANGAEHTLDSVVSLGRSPECDIVLDDLLVSRRHAEIRPALGSHLLIDLGSSNGTTVDDEPVVQHLLRDGDCVRIGTHLLRYCAD